MGSSLLAIALLHWIALITPGPNVLVVSNLAANGSRRTAVCAALGVTVVAGIWSSLAVLGVNAIFTAHHYLRMAVQFAGGCYLLYVALRFWRIGAADSDKAPIQLSSLAAFRLGFLTNFMNPKSVLFFSSVLATGLPARPSVLLLVSAVILVIFNAFVWHMTLALAFSHHRVQAAYSRSRRAIGRTASILIGAFGVRLLITVAGQLRSR
jgi:threonine efflux protein